MPEVPDTVDDAIEPLSSPSTNDVFEATRPFSAREIASAAASEALSGGSGAGPSCLLGKLGNLDIHAPGSYPLLWTNLFDDVWNANPLAEIPPGLGMTFVFDGSSATITTTEAGIWAFRFAISVAAADADWRGGLNDTIGLVGGNLPASVATGGNTFQLTSIGALPADAVGAPRVETLVGATANPFNLTSAGLVITRLA